MIHDLHIQNYRAFADLTVDPLKRVNLIVGANNVGKTSLLEAIYLLASQDKQDSLTAILQERGEFLSNAEDSRRGRSNPNQVPWNYIEGFLIAPLFHGRIVGTLAPIKIQSNLPPMKFSLAAGNGEGEKGHIDEIDTGLYYAALKDMWRVVIETAVKQDAQIFATTHSWDCVKAFQQALSPSSHHAEGALVRLDREGNQVKTTIYNSDELDIAIPQGIEVR